MTLSSIYNLCQNFRFPTEGRSGNFMSLIFCGRFISLTAEMARAGAADIPAWKWKQSNIMESLVYNYHHTSTLKQLTLCVCLTLLAYDNLEFIYNLPMSWNIIPTYLLHIIVIVTVIQISLVRNTETIYYSWLLMWEAKELSEVLPLTFQVCSVPQSWLKFLSYWFPAPFHPYIILLICNAPDRKENRMLMGQNSTKSVSPLKRVIHAFLKVA